MGRMGRMGEMGRMVVGYWRLAAEPLSAQR
jgi:hypothetical protein